VLVPEKSSSIENDLVSNLSGIHYHSKTAQAKLEAATVQEITEADSNTFYTDKSLDILDCLA
jgi:hypothetical protein